MWRRLPAYDTTKGEDGFYADPPQAYMKGDFGDPRYRFLEIAVVTGDGCLE